MGRMKKWHAFVLACSMSLGLAGVALIQRQADAASGEGAATITSETQGDTFVLLQDEVAEFALNYEKASAIHYAPEDGVATDRYVPKPATLSWENTRDDALYYTLRVGLEQDLSDADSYIVADTSADIEYLFSAKHYYYQVYAHYDDDEVVKSRVFNFYTADVPRTVYIEGVTNTRDIGGRYVQDGKYQIKQGMVYRGAEVDRELGAITQEGRRVMLYELGIKTDLDIRGGDVQNATGTSPIDSSLNYVHLEAPWYTHISSAEYKEALTTEFRTFANPENYPIYFHCSVGRDRAGTLSCLLGALLGVEEKDLFRDYEMSFFSRIGLTNAAQAQGEYLGLINSLQSTISYLKAYYPSDSLMGSVERFVTEYLGLTKTEVDTIRAILWEEAGEQQQSAKSVSKSKPLAAAAKNSVATAVDARDFACAYSVSTVGLPQTLYGSSEVKTYTAAEAAANAVPDGYENEVIEVLPLASNATGNCGVLLDFSAEKIPVSLIKSLQFRIYLGVADKNAGTSYPQIRIAQPNVSGVWIHQLNQANATGEWTTVSVAYNDRFASLGEDGTLASFELSLRTQTQIPFYIDSIVCEMKESDGLAPVINYTGSDVISIELGKPLGWSINATDRQQGNLPVEYVWEDGVVLNDNGTPAQAGSYTLTLKAVDYYGVVGTKTLTVNVIEKDTVAPEIGLKFSEVKAKAGTKPMLVIPITDDSGHYNVVENWSAGALDNRGRLTVGVHTWTITASDAFDNETSKTVTFTVTESEPTYAVVIDEAELYGTVTVTFNGQNPVTVRYGFKIEEPAEPVREDTEAVRYEFIGWYNGEERWDFNEDVATQDLDLQARWEEIAQVYNVYFEDVNETKEVEYGNVIPENLIPEAPEKRPTSKKEYTFEGWYLGDTLWNFETDVVTGDITLVAKYLETVRKYTVTFDGENEQQYEYGSKITPPETPTKEATDTVRYEFEGWYLGNKLWDFETNTVNNNIYLKSKWTEIALEEEGPTTENSSQQGDKEEESSTGCGGVISCAAGGMLALGVALVAFFKKKEN